MFLIAALRFYRDGRPDPFLGLMVWLLSKGGNQ
jgi:hypothetical protein